MCLSTNPVTTFGRPEVTVKRSVHYRYCVFVDESGYNVWTARSHGKAQYGESDLRADDRFLSLRNVTSRNCSPFQTNECVFSRNEQQKVY